MDYGGFAAGQGGWPTMRAVIQRVSRAKVAVNNITTGEIKNGLLVLFAAGQGDNDEDIEWAVKKISELRIFEDENGKMNLSVKDVGGSLLVVSQFTLYGDIRKGRRPSFTMSMPPEEAEAMYGRFVDRCKMENLAVETGEFKAYMQVSLVNDGPVTLIVDSKDRKRSRRANPPDSCC